jgi:N-methylhydantoinase B
VGQDVLLHPGLTAPIHIIAPPGCAVNAASPAPVAGRVPLSFHVTDVITRALALALPDEVPVPHEGGDLFLAHGVDSAGKPFRALDVYHGGWGARPDRDGIDGVVAMKSGGFSAKPAEVLEREFPLVVEGWGFVPDSGGPGRFRGSVSVHRSWRLLAPARVLVRTNNVAGTEGFAGGHTGAASETVLHDAAGDVSLPRRTHVTVDVPAGTTVRHRLPGAAGYGPPWERETAAVLTDVRAGKVTRDGAREAYGVVIDDTGAVDQVATEKARRRMADSASDNGEPR